LAIFSITANYFFNINYINFNFTVVDAQVVPVTGIAVPHLTVN